MFARLPFPQAVRRRTNESGESGTGKAQLVAEFYKITLCSDAETNSYKEFVAVIHARTVDPRTPYVKDLLVDTLCIISIMGLSLAKRFSMLPNALQEEWLNSLSQDMLEEIDRGEWWWTARPEQIPPDGGWFVLLYLAGRGAGKTRAGAEWLISRVEEYPVDQSGAATEHLVVAETLSDARTICVEGPSGLLRVLDRRGYQQISGLRELGERTYRYTKSPKPKLEIGPPGTKIYFEGADKPDVGRGYNASSGWLDEIIKWPYPKQAWIEGIMPSMRANLVGDHPRILVTTTPKPLDLLYEWVARDDGSVHIVRGSTYDNADNLSEQAMQEMRTRYEGTTIGRQELYGELLDSFDGSLFRQGDIDRYRIDIPPELAQIALGVDPSLTGENAEMGIVVVGRDREGHLYVLGDETVPGTGKLVAEYAWEIFTRYKCDMLIYENTQGKEWLSQVMLDAYKELKRQGYFDGSKYQALSGPPMKAVDSKRGKRLRAQPVAMRMEQGRMHHVGYFDALERQMVSWVPETTARTHRDSPDRLDALVHAAWHLIGFDKRQVSIARRKVRVTAPGEMYVPDYFSEISRADGRHPSWM